MIRFRHCVNEDLDSTLNYLSNCWRIILFTKIYKDRHFENTSIFNDFSSVVVKHQMKRFFVFYQLKDRSGSVSLVFKSCVFFRKAIEGAKSLGCRILWGRWSRQHENYVTFLFWKDRISEWSGIWPIENVKQTPYLSDNFFQFIEQLTVAI